MGTGHRKSCYIKADIITDWIQLEDRWNERVPGVEAPSKVYVAKT